MSTLLPPTTEAPAAPASTEPPSPVACYEPTAAVTVAPRFRYKPLVGRNDLVATFGKVQVDAGQIVNPRGWESEWMTKLDQLPGWPHKVYLNKIIVEPTQALFAAWAAEGGFPIHTLGFFSPRAKRGLPELLSLHTYAIAFDINADDNPLQAPGDVVKTTIPVPWIRIAEAMGWTWGGRFHRPDAMHFQWAVGV